MEDFIKKFRQLTSVILILAFCIAFSFNVFASAEPSHGGIPEIPEEYIIVLNDGEPDETGCLWYEVSPAYYTEYLGLEVVAQASSGKYWKTGVRREYAYGTDVPTSIAYSERHATYGYASGHLAIYKYGSYIGSKVTEVFYEGYLYYGSTVFSDLSDI